MTGKTKIKTPARDMKAGSAFSTCLSMRWYCIILFAVVFAVYGNTLLNGYVLDDATVIYENSIVKKGIRAIPELLTTPRLSGYLKLPADSYRPVSLILFAIEYQFFGASPFSGHFFTVLLFAGCVLSLFLFLVHLLGGEKVGVAFVASLLFAVHPVHTEVAANIKSCDELLAYSLGFMALSSFTVYVRTGNTSRLLLGSLAYFLALMSKESVITFVVVVPLVFFAYVNEERRRSMFITAGTILPAVLFLLISKAVLASHHANMQGAEDFTTNALLGSEIIGTRIPTAFYVLGKYLLLLLVPYPLLCNYSYSSIPFVGWGNIWVLLSFVAYVALLVAGIFRLVRRKNDAGAFAILFYLVTLSLYANVFFLITSQMAERFLFLPSTGFCLAAALMLEMPGGEKVRTLMIGKRALAVLIPVLVVFGGMAIARNAEWKDNYTLFSADVEKAPEDCKLNYYKAVSIPVDEHEDAAKKERVYKEKMSYLQKAISIYPDFAEAHTTLAKIYEAAGMYDSALAHNLIVIKGNWENSIATYHAGVASYALGKYEDAVTWFKATIRLSPEYKLAYLNLAKCYADAHLPDSAIVYFHKTLSLDGKQVLALRGLAMAFLEQRKYDSAAVHMMRVIELQPQSVDDINNLGAIYLSAGKHARAIEQFSRTIALNPQYVVAYGNMGIAYLQAGQYEEAIRNFRRQLEANPNDLTNIPSLATAYEKAGKKDSAIIYGKMLK